METQVNPHSSEFVSAVRLTSGVHEVTLEAADSAAQEAARIGAAVFVLSTEGASTRAEFFDAVRTNLPLDPPLIGSRSWDALSDSLWGGIDSVDASAVVIIWKGASDLRRNASDEFEIAMAVLRDLTSSLGNWEDTDGEPKRVCVYVV
jgi:Barstar (barnase inhibitor)